MGHKPPEGLKHPRTGAPTSYSDLEREFGLNRKTIQTRFKAGKQGWALVEPPIFMTPERLSSVRKKMAENRRRANDATEDINRFLQSSAGRLATHLFRDYAAARR